MTQQQIVIDIPASLMTAVPAMPSQDTLIGIGALAGLTVGGLIVLFIAYAIVAGFCKAINDAGERRKAAFQRRMADPDYSARYLRRKKIVDRSVAFVLYASITLFVLGGIIGHSLHR